ncbi:L-lactate transporter-like [Daphnia pulicaria]|uniref:L-lactate transporter-like n=1 Tax=Daphnia pulicaria TaxID=35523 RepID=UPI001EEA0642|nr:L-lactate transporter-like [Daphnia pulicaria]
MFLLPLQTLDAIVNKIVFSRKYVVLFCGFLLHLSYGSVLTFGNMTTYITSYQRNVLLLDVTYADTMWIQAISFATTGIALPLGSYLEKIWGPRLTIIVSMFFMSGGVLLTSMTVTHSLSLVVFTYGLLFGVGARAGYMSPIAAAMRWFPDSQHGVVNGFIIAGYGMGSFVFSLIQIGYVNPQNIPADSTGYFDDVTVLERVPGLFIFLGCIYLAIQLLAVLFITNPPVCDVVKEETIDVQLSIPPEPMVPLLHVIRSPRFVALWFTFLFNDQTIIGVIGLYKAFGLNFWTDDKNLTLVGSVGAIFNALGRLAWGFLADRVQYRTLMLILTWSVVALLLSINATPLTNCVWFYAFWIIMLNIITPGTYILLPKAVRLYFGSYNIPFNYGLLFTSFIVGGPLSALVSITFLDAFGWIGVFWSMAAFSAAAGVITWFLP